MPVLHYGYEDKYLTSSLHENMLLGFQNVLGNSSDILLEKLVPELTTNVSLVLF